MNRFLFYRYDDARDLRVLTHLFPTRRSSDQKDDGGGEQRIGDERRRVGLAVVAAEEEPQHQRRRDDREDADARHLAVRRADQPGHITRDRRDDRANEKDEQQGGENDGQDRKSVG